MYKVKHMHDSVNKPNVTWTNVTWTNVTWTMRNVNARENYSTREKQDAAGRENENQNRSPTASRISRVE